VVEVPLHPRLARMLLVAPGAERRTAALLAALVSERDIFRRDVNDGQRTADVASRLAVLGGRPAVAPAAVDREAVSMIRRRAHDLTRRVANTERARDGSAPIERRRPSGTGPSPTPTDRAGAIGPGQDPGSLLAEAYPDRIAQARGGGRYRLRHGAGAVLPDHDPLGEAGWLVVAELEGPAGSSGRADGRIRLAAALDRSDVERIGDRAIRTEETLEWDDQFDDLRVVTRTTLGSLDLGSFRAPAQGGTAATAALVARAIQTGLAGLRWTPAARSLQSRAGWARQQLGEDWPDVSDGALAARADEWLAPLLRGAIGRTDLARVDPSAAIRAAMGGRLAELNRLLPPTLDLQAGRSAPIDYSNDRPRAAVRVQDLFGTTVHPSVAEGRVPVTLELLSPARRPIQITADLPGFWNGSWRQVRKEMAARYPKHDWPEDPAAALPPPSPNPSGRRH
jgi:ATP-dependent helicase HrpB